VAEAFAKHFQSVYNNTITAGPYCGSLSSDFLHLPPINELDILRAIKRLRPSKSVGPDGIPSFIIKGSSTIFAPLIKYIFNLSLSQEHFPAQWKKAIIVPILKKGNTSFVGNYRPISLLNNFSNVFEFAIHDHMSHYFTHKLHPSQHVVLKHKSTTTNLVTYLDFISPLVSSQRQVDSIYFNLSSAFDLVPHPILLNKLCAYGLSDGYVNWFRSYLTNRQSSVRISDTSSLPFKVLSGMPQGSVLGPSLFSVFINDLCTAIEYSNFLLFADDIKIFHAINSADDCILLQSDINRIQDWVSANCMKLNIGKTRVIAFTRKTNVLYYNYKICDSSVTRTDTIKDLGILLDSKLHFHAHVDYIFSQSVRTLGSIRTVTCSFSTLDSLLILYLTPVRPKLEYASKVWNSVPATDAKKLERIQRID
jgi:hypothetical protein